MIEGGAMSEPAPTTDESAILRDREAQRRRERSRGSQREAPVDKDW